MNRFRPVNRPDLTDLNRLRSVRSGFLTFGKKSRPVTVPVKRFLAKKPDRTGLQSTKIDEGSPEELSEFYAEVSSILVDTGAFAY